jgi:hypothetical protein
MALIPLNRQPRPAGPTTQRLFGRIKAKPAPDHYGLVRTPHRPDFDAVSHGQVGIIEDFPAKPDQFCLIFVHDPFSLVPERNFATPRPSCPPGERRNPTRVIHLL